MQWLVDVDMKEVEVRSFETGRTALYKITDVLRSEVLPKIEISAAALFA